jgi:hypothetical protein
MNGGFEDGVAGRRDGKWACFLARSTGFAMAFVMEWDIRRLLLWLRV